MTKEELKDLFPLYGNITQEIIDSAKIYNSQRCIGALSLRSALGHYTEKHNFTMSCGGYSGNLILNLNDENSDIYVRLTTEEKVNMMKITEPQLVTFIIKEYA
jgi:hypothetical protein